MKSRHRRAPLPLLALCSMLSAPLAAADQRPSFDHASTDKKIVALTFDADMTPGMLSELKSRRVSSWYNEKVIEVLRQEQVPATLFLTGLWIETYSEATKQLSADPLFELGSHSYSHGAFHSPCYRLFPIPESKQAAEVQKTDDLLRQYAASYKKYFRFPGLCSDAAAVKKVEDQGYTVIGGDVDGADAFEKNPKWIASERRVARSSGQHRCPSHARWPQCAGNRCRTPGHHQETPFGGIHLRQSIGLAGIASRRTGKADADAPPNDKRRPCRHAA